MGGENRRRGKGGREGGMHEVSERGRKGGREGEEEGGRGGGREEGREGGRERRREGGREQGRKGGKEERSVCEREKEEEGRELEKIKGRGGHEKDTPGRIYLFVSIAYQRRAIQDTPAPLVTMLLLSSSISLLPRHQIPSSARVKCSAVCRLHVCVHVCMSV